jgi:hypothetical protein
MEGTTLRNPWASVLVTRFPRPDDSFKKAAALLQVLRVFIVGAVRAGFIDARVVQPAPQQLSAISRQ